LFNEIVARRFKELERDFSQLPFTGDSNDLAEERVVPNGQWRQWATSVENLLVKVCGESSPHYKNWRVLYEGCRGHQYHLGGLNAVFRSAKADFEGGYIFNTELRISGEVFGDFVALAKQALNEGHKDVAAVLACAALEDALKRYAVSKNLTVADKSMSDVVNSLKAEGLVGGAQKSLLDAMPRVRNFAMHAEWAKISEPEVSSVIAFVEQFLLTNFGGRS
jgi:hypothetical protein